MSEPCPAGGPPPPITLAVVVPVYDESPVVKELHARLRAVLDALKDSRGIRSEIVAVDDGSRDGSGAILDDLARVDPALRVIHLERNRGQHEAILEGFARTEAPSIITIDADLQNPPEEIPRLHAALLEGHDLVAARRIRRHDSLARRMASRAANLTSAALTRHYTRVPLHDVGCMLRGYSRGLVKAMLDAAAEPGHPAPFVPALALRFARDVLEIDVAHSPRGHGRSRYGWLGLLDLHVRLLATLARRGSR
jgi:undecaprenyl-phosphate 4-deoxy-4-formamido-L-arabinose transferase